MLARSSTFPIAARLLLANARILESALFCELLEYSTSHRKKLLTYRLRLLPLNAGFFERPRRGKGIESYGGHGKQYIIGQWQCRRDHQMNYPQEGMIIPRQLAEMISTPPDDAPQEITMAEVEIAQTDPNHVDEMVIVEPRITPNYLVATATYRRPRSTTTTTPTLHKDPKP